MGQHQKQMQNEINHSSTKHERNIIPWNQSEKQTMTAGWWIPQEYLTEVFVV